MRKLIGVLLVALLVVGIVGVIGCGGTKNVTIDKNGKKIDVQTENGETKVKTDEGEMTVTSSVTEEEIGVPFYPGAKMDKEAPGMVTKNAEGEVTGAVVLWTDDPPSEVIAWYREKLAGKPNFTEMTATADQALFGYQEGDVAKTVAIGIGTVDNPGKTQIAIASAPGSAMPDLPKP